MKSPYVIKITKATNVLLMVVVFHNPSIYFALCSWSKLHNFTVTLTIAPASCSLMSPSSPEQPCKYTQYIY